MNPPRPVDLENYIPEAGPYGGREKRGKWEELVFFSPNGFAFLTMEGGSGKFQGVS